MTNTQNNKRIRNEILLLIGLAALLILTKSISYYSEQSKLPTQEEIDKLANTPYPCGNHTYSYEEPELLNGIYRNEKMNAWFFIEGNRIEFHGTNEQIIALTSVQLQYCPPHDTSLPDSAADDWADGLEIEAVNTYHYSKDNEIAGFIADKTVISLLKSETSYTPTLFYETSPNKIIFGDTEFLYVE